MISQSERIEALLMTEKMLAGRVSKSKIIIKLAEEYHIDENNAKKLIKQVLKQWVIDSETYREQTKARTLKTLSLLFVMALKEKDIDQCRKIEEFRAKIEGLIGGQKEIIPVMETNGLSKFSDRTEEEVEFYLKNDCFPEEYDGAVN
jgi:hypothetical protein